MKQAEKKKFERTVTPMDARYFKTPDDCRTLSTRGELEEFLQDSDAIEWHEMSAGDIALIDTGFVPIIQALDPVLPKLHFMRFGYETVLPEVDISKDIDMKRSAEDTGLFIAMPIRNDLSLLPLWNVKTYVSALERAGMLCPTMTRMNPDRNRQALQTADLAAWCTKALQLNSEKVKVPFRYGIPMVVRSKEYVVLPARELVETFEEEMKKNHPNLEFESGKVDVEYLVCTYTLNDPEKEDSFKLLLQDAGHPCNEVKVKLRFSTSEIGKSGVHVTLSYEADGVSFGLGKGIHMEHKGDASIEKFASLLTNIGQLFKENEARIEELGNMDISNPAFVIEEIGKEYTNFPKNIVKDVAADLKVQYPDGGTGIDVYLALHEIIQRQAKAKNLSPNGYITLCETTEKMMKLPFDAIDRGEGFRKI